MNNRRKIQELRGKNRVNAFSEMNNRHKILELRLTVGETLNIEHTVRTRKI